MPTQVKNNFPPSSFSITLFFSTILNDKELQNKYSSESPLHCLIFKQNFASEICSSYIYQ